MKERRLFDVFGAICLAVVMGLHESRQWGVSV